MTRVLIVDNDVDFAGGFATCLAGIGYDVDAAADWRSGARFLDINRPDLVLLSLALPETDAVTLVTQVRRRTPSPIGVLAADGDAAKQLAALDAGADGVLDTSADMDELLARVRALLRRPPVPIPRQSRVVTGGELSIDLAGASVLRGGEPVALTRTEWRILELLVRNAGRLVTQHEILLELWGPSHVANTNYLRVYMAQLRRKLEDDPVHPRHLITQVRMGYRFEP